MINDLELNSQDLETVVVGRTLQYFVSVDSTNNLLKEAARTGAPEGLVIVADEQVAGRGRRGRGWAAPPGSSLLVSILLRPTWLPPQDAFTLTMLAAIAAAEAIQITSGLQVDLKWPNDLQIGARKLGGLLTETELDAGSLHWAVIGCGINVNWTPQAVPALAQIATSLQAELGYAVARRDLLRALLERLDVHYQALRLGARSALFQAWRNRLVTLNQSVQVETPQGLLFGVAEDVSRDGALIIRDQAGQRHRVTAGDVSVRPYPLS